MQDVKDFIIHTYRDIFSTVTDALFPVNCVQCNDDGRWLCEKCEYSLPLPVQRPDCNGICATTLTTGTRRLVHKIKYRGATDAIKTAAHILTQTCAEEISEHLSYYPDANVALTYVPMHPSKKKLRGFNQSALVAKYVSDELNIPLVETLIKNDYHRRLANIKRRADREKLIAGTMEAISKNIEPNTLFIIVDDVITSGSTMREATRALAEYTTIKPLCIALAHTPLYKSKRI